MLFMGKKYILAKDARDFIVEFSEERWNYIINKHEDLNEYGITEEHFRRAIENPQHGCIYSSHVFRGNCAVYYLQIDKKLELVVVVKYTGEVGEIVTAHFSSKRPDGEEIIWPRTNL